jgi:2-polyprenyl-3-methyl-5-hydroxy-6-metoxy-1,4-benzoquinol methylase
VRREDWDARYAAVENLWAAKPNRFLVAEVADLDRTCARSRMRRGTERDLARDARLAVTGVDYSEVAIAKATRRAERDGVDAEFVCATS